MSKGGKLAFGAILLLVLLLTYQEATEPEPVNWNPSYQETDKIALGSYVFFESWQEHGDANLEKITIPPYEFLDADREGTYFFLNDFIVYDDSELNKLLNWVEEGNRAFIAADYISKNLLDTLEIKATTHRGIKNFISRPGLNFVHPDLQNPAWYNFTYDTEAVYFSKIDTLHHTVLGLAKFESDSTKEMINFIKAPFGKGEFLLHSNPQALGNYFLLSGDNYKYAEGVLAYLDPKSLVYWDKYYKSGKTFYTSPLYVLLNERALKWAYYFLLLGCVLFIIFEGKRKQRPVPIVVPLKNQTYEYAGTIGDLYLEQKHYRELALKKIDHFYDYIRTRHRIDTTAPAVNFYGELAEKSNNTKEAITALFEFFTTIRNTSEITKQQFQDLYDRIELFKQSTNE